jgi:hypothetical protein
MLVCGMFMGASALRMRPASWPLDVIVCAFLIWLASVNSWNTMVVECDGERLRAWLTPFSIPASFVGRPIDLSLSRIVHVGKHYSSPLHSVRVTDADGEHVSLPFGSRTARVPQFVADTLAEHIEALRPEADTASVATGASA